MGEERRFQKRFDCEEKAERWLLGLRYEVDNGQISSESKDNLTVGVYLSGWLKNTVEGTVSRHTQRDYEDKVRLHLSPALGHIRLKDLTTDHLNRLYRDLYKDLSARSVRYVHATIRKALHDAEGRDLVRKNVANWAKLPKQGHVEKPVMSRADAMLFLEAIKGDRLEALYLLSVTTGLRRGELLGLKWEDIDLDAGTMKVTRSLDTHNGPPTDNAPKRRASRRAAKLPSPVVDALKRRRHAYLEENQSSLWQEHGYVFPTTRGTPNRGDNVLARGLKPLMEKAGLPKYNFQTVRRSNATFLVLLGIHPRTAMAWLGHSDVATTMKIYQQAPDELQEEAADKMGEFLFGRIGEAENEQ